MFSLHKCVLEGTTAFSFSYVISGTGQECNSVICEDWLTLNVTVALSLQRIEMHKFITLHLPQFERDSWL